MTLPLRQSRTLHPNEQAMLDNVPERSFHSPARRILHERVDMISRLVPNPGSIDMWVQSKEGWPLWNDYLDAARVVARVRGELCGPDNRYCSLRRWRDVYRKIAEEEAGR